MSNDEFERRLQEQVFVAPTARTRERILKAASTTQFNSRHEPDLTWWRALLWPAPHAWAGMAAIWVVLLVVNRAGEPEENMSASLASAPAQQVAYARYERNHLFTELIDELGSDAMAEPPKPVRPAPRSEARQSFVCV